MNIVCKRLSPSFRFNLFDSASERKCEQPLEKIINECEKVYGRQFLDGIT